MAYLHLTLGHIKKCSIEIIDKDSKSQYIKLVFFTKLKEVSYKIYEGNEFNKLESIKKELESNLNQLLKNNDDDDVLLINEDYDRKYIILEFPDKILTYAAISL